jgi:hypothetical protein
VSIRWRRKVADRILFPSVTLTPHSSNKENTVAYSGTVRVGDFGSTVTVSGTYQMTTASLYYAYFHTGGSGLQWTTDAFEGSRSDENRCPIGCALKTTAPDECMVFSYSGPIVVTAAAIRANAITAVSILAGTITADKITVSTLSALSADIGTVTAGALQSADYNAATGEGFKLDLTNATIYVGGGNISFAETGITVDIVDTEPLPDEFFILKRNGVQGASIEMFNFAIGATYYERLILTGKGQVQMFADSGGSYDAYITVSRGVGGGFPVASLITLDSKVVKLTMTTETLEFIDAGSTGATEQDWIEVEVGGNQGYIRVYATK